MPTCAPEYNEPEVWRPRTMNVTFKLYLCQTRRRGSENVYLRQVMQVPGVATRMALRGARIIDKTTNLHQTAPTAVTYLCKSLRQNRNGTRQCKVHYERTGTDTRQRSKGGKRHSSSCPLDKLQSRYGFQQPQFQ
jgi:hypothetical protein